MTDSPTNDPPQHEQPPAPPVPPQRPDGARNLEAGAPPETAPAAQAPAPETAGPAPTGTLGRLRTKAESAARQAVASPHVQSAANKTKTVAKQAAETPRGQAVVGKTKTVAKQAAESSTGQAVTRQVKATTERVIPPAAGMAMATPLPDTASAPNPPTPKPPLPKTPMIAVVLTLLASVVAVGVTFFPWVTVDASQSAELAPDFVPDRLVNASSSYRASAHTILGIGTLLAFIVVAAAGTVLAGLRGRGRWPFGLASLLYVFAAFIAAITIIALRIAKTGYRWVLPDDWVGDSPTVALSAAGLVFVIAAIVAAVFAARIAFARKPGQQPT